MKDDARIRKKALRSMQAMTAGALLFAGVSCTDVEESETSWNLQDPDTGGDATLDANGDTGSDVGDTGPDTTFADASDTGDAGTDAETLDIGQPGNDTGIDTGPDAEIADVGLLCNDQESTGTCNEECTIHNDIDCCHEDEFNCWSAGECWVGGCAVPGPFVPPAMTA